MLTPKAAQSACSGDLKCTGDNKLQQIWAAWELLKLGGSLGYGLNPSMCEVEHLHRGALCKHNRDPTADKIQVIKPETLPSCSCYPPLLPPDLSDNHSFSLLMNLGLKVPKPARGGSYDAPPPLLRPQHLSHFLGLCQGRAAKGTHATRLTPGCQASDQRCSCRVGLRASKRWCTKVKWDGERRK